jgi:predicted porin
MTGTLEYTYFRKQSLVKGSYSVLNYSADDTDLDYLSGTGSIFGLSYDTEIGKYNLLANMEVQQDSLNDTDDNVGSKNILTLGLSVYRQISNKWNIDSGFTYSVTNYEADASGVTQEDKALSLIININYSINRNFSIYLKEKFLKNSSNLTDEDEDNNYQQNVLSLGLTASY